MAETIHVRGEGGGIFEMSLPLPGHVQQRLDKGYLQRVNPDGSPYVEPVEQGSDLTIGVPPRPDVNARKADWVGYAVSLGMRPDDAEGMTKQDLIELIGTQGSGTGRAGDDARSG